MVCHDDNEPGPAGAKRRVSKPIDPQALRLCPVPGGGELHRAKNPLRVLIVEDSDDDAMLVMRALRRGGFTASHRRVQTADEMGAALAQERWDAVLSDFSMPGFNGMDALRIFQSMDLDIPFILISGTIGEETAVEAMKAGASDYLMKESLARLAPALERELEEAKFRAAHRRAQRDLATSEQRLRTVIETEPECVKVVSREGVLLEMNAAGLAMLEAGSLAEAQSKPLLDFIVPEHRAAFVALHQRVIAGESGILQFEVIGLRGGMRWLETHAAPLGGANGEGATLLGVTRDVTGRRRAERELRESEARFRSLTELSSDWFWEQNEEFRFVMFSGGDRDAAWGNDRFSSVGLRRWELPGIVPLSESWDEHKAHLEAHRPFHDFEYLRILESGSHRYIAASGEPVFGTGGRFTGYRGVATDITERKRTERELQRFRAAMDISAEAIVLVDRASMRFIDVNQTTCAMSGYTREQLLGMTPMDLTGRRRESLEAEYDELIADGSGVADRIEGEYPHKDGSTVFVETRRRALATETGWVIVGTTRDITARKEGEARISRLNRVYAVLSGINTLIVRVRDRDELFAEACRIGVEAGHFAKAWLGLFDRGSKQLRIVAACGGDPRFFPRLETQLNRQFPTGGGLVFRALATLRPVISNHMASDPEVLMKDYVVDGGAQSLAILPLIVSGEAAGVFVLNADVPAFFDDEEMKLLVELAGDVAFAIDHIDKQARLDYLAYYDELTGLANRSLFLERLAQYARSAADEGHKLALLLIDLERFRNINDSLGRGAGDALLRQVAEWIKQDFGGANVVARVGGDQFAVILPKARNASSVAGLLDMRMKAFLSHPFDLNDTVLRIALKVGVALYPDDGADADMLMRNAEAALKRAKARGDRFLFYEQKMTDSVAGKLTLENKLRLALENGEYVLHYQPKISLETGKLTGAEALIRWNDPQSGLVPPGRFIPILEETGLIHDVGRWALRKALEEYLRWRAAGLPAVRIAVNVSPLQLRDRGFVAEVGQAIGIEPHAPEGLELEITESLIMEDVRHSIAGLQSIRDMNVTIAIDDFGTGFSSLSYLAKLPVDALKIDRSFVVDMTAGPDGLALVSTIINLAHSFKLKVVAEGVETDEQSRLLRLLGCDEMQGFLFSKPVPAAVFEARFLSPTAPA